MCNNTGSMLLLEHHFTEPEYPHTAYTQPSPLEGLKILPSSQTIWWSPILEPNVNPPGTHPIQAEVESGDTLYLPAGWWYHIRQSESMVITLNWWYGTEMNGMSWVMLSFLREVCLEGNEETEDDSS